MKTKTLFLVLTLFLAFAGCRTIKQMSKTDTASSTAANVKTQTSDQVQLDIAQKTDTKQAVDSSKTIVDKGSTVENSTEETEHIKLSVPDQNGNQYITDKIKTKKTTKKGENRNLKVDQEASSKSDREVQLRDRSDSKSDSAAADKTKTKETSNAKSLQTSETPTPGWVYVVILVVAAIVSGGAYLILKRYNIIK